MSEKKMPEWGEIVHVNGREMVVMQVSEGKPYPAVHLLKRDGKNEITSLCNIDEYKPRMITIGDMEVPEPAREPLKRGDAYWRVGLDATPECGWTESPYDYIRLYQGRIHRTKEAAEQHRKALIRVSGGETE